MNLKIGSLFDGSGGFPLAASMCGIEPTWAAEVEPYPIAVTRSRFPNMKHLGSVTEVKGNEVEPVDIITFGAPCQDLSVAGKRAGLRHEGLGDEETTRSGLFMEAVRIIKEMREATNGKYPRYAIYENVPGAFSSSKGQDFRIVCEELIKIVEPTASMPDVPQNGWSYADVYCGDGWSLAYRVLDAQYWGVPQRRRRIYLVLDLGGQRAGKILFEREGLRGHLAESGTQREVLASHAEGSTGADDCKGVGIVNAIGGNAENYQCSDRLPTLTNGNAPGFMNAIAYPMAAGQGASNTGPSVIEAVGFDVYNMAVTGDVAKTLNAAASDADHIPCVFEREDPLNAIGFDTYNMTATGDKSVTLRAGSEHNYAPVFVPYTLKIRSGVDVDSAGKAAGKGALIQTNLSATLAASQDQYLFQPILDDQGGSQISVRTDGKCPTLRAEMHGNVPAVMEPYTLEPGIAAREGGHIYEGVSGTLRANAGDNQMAVAYSIENHPADSRVNIDDSGKVQTLTSRMGTGGGNVPMVMESIPIEGNGSRPSHLGDGYSESDKMYTLNTIERHAVAYGMETFHCTSEEEMVPTLKARDWKDPHVVVYWDGTQTCGTLTANNAGGNQRMPDKDNFNCVIEEEPIAIEPGEEVYGVDVRNMTEYPELYPTLQAKPNGGQSLNFSGACRVRYIVRRLTPTECARLQGFPDKWGHPDVKTELTDEEYRFWLNVRNTHAAINDKAVKEYTKEQMLKWYNGLHTDSAEYKLWGNGIALPCALYVMEGITDAN